MPGTKRGQSGDKTGTKRGQNGDKTGTKRGQHSIYENESIHIHSYMDFPSSSHASAKGRLSCPRLSPPGAAARGLTAWCRATCRRLAVHGRAPMRTWAQEGLPLAPRHGQRRGTGMPAGRVAAHTSTRGGGLSPGQVKPPHGAMVGRWRGLATWGRGRWVPAGRYLAVGGALGGSKWARRAGAGVLASAASSSGSSPTLARGSGARYLRCSMARSSMASR